MLFTPFIMTDAKSEAAQAAAADSSSSAQNPSTGAADDAQPQQPPAAAQDAADKSAHATGTSTPAVRFSSAVQEFSPTAEAPGANESPAAAPDAPASESQEVTPEQLRAFTKSLHGPLLQERRMNTYQFEAFSLPPSRVSRCHFFFRLCGAPREFEQLRRKHPAKPRDSANATFSRCPLEMKILPTQRAFIPPAPLATILPMAAPASQPWLRRLSRPRARRASDEPEISVPSVQPAVTQI